MGARINGWDSPYRSVKRVVNSGGDDDVTAEEMARTMRGRRPTRDEDADARPDVLTAAGHPSDDDDIATARARGWRGGWKVICGLPRQLAAAQGLADSTLARFRLDSTLTRRRRSVRATMTFKVKVNMISYDIISYDI